MIPAASRQRQSRPARHTRRWIEAGIQGPHSLEMAAATGATISNDRQQRLDVARLRGQPALRPDHDGQREPGAHRQRETAPADARAHLPAWRQPREHASGESLVAGEQRLAAHPFFDRVAFLHGSSGQTSSHSRSRNLPREIWDFNVPTGQPSAAAASSCVSPCSKHNTNAARCISDKRCSAATKSRPSPQAGSTRRLSGLFLEEFRASLLAAPLGPQFIRRDGAEPGGKRSAAAKTAQRRGTP